MRKYFLFGSLTAYLEHGLDTLIEEAANCDWDVYLWNTNDPVQLLECFEGYNSFAEIDKEVYLTLKDLK